VLSAEEKIVSRIVGSKNGLGTARQPPPGHSWPFGEFMPHFGGMQNCGTVKLTNCLVFVL